LKGGVQTGRSDLFKKVEYAIAVYTSDCAAVESLYRRFLPVDYKRPLLCASAVRKGLFTVSSTIILF
jgi:hypothetical protein